LAIVKAWAIFGPFNKLHQTHFVVVVRKYLGEAIFRSSTAAPGETAPFPRCYAPDLANTFSICAKYHYKLLLGQGQS